MARKRHTAEQVIHLLRQVEVGLANGINGPGILPRAGDQRANVLPLEERERRLAGEPGPTAPGVGEGERTAEAGSGGSHPGQVDLEGGSPSLTLVPPPRVQTAPTPWTKDTSHSTVRCGTALGGRSLMLGNCRIVSWQYGRHKDAALPEAGAIQAVLIPHHALLHESSKLGHLLPVYVRHRRDHLSSPFRPSLPAR